MKKLFSCLLALALAFPLFADNVMTKENGMYVVNTTTLGKKVRGYVADTPLKIYIQKDRIVRIEALKNQETPKHNALVKKNMLTKYEGMRVKDVKKQQVDGVTGATFTSNAMRQTVLLGIEYYRKHK